MGKATEYLAFNTSVYVLNLCFFLLSQQIFQSKIKNILHSVFPTMSFVLITINFNKNIVIIPVSFHMTYDNSQGICSLEDIVKESRNTELINSSKYQPS